jgi:hypothetical protein
LPNISRAAKSENISELTLLALSVRRLNGVINWRDLHVIFGGWFPLVKGRALRSVVELNARSRNFHPILLFYSKIQTSRTKLKFGEAV